MPTENQIERFDDCLDLSSRRDFMRRLGGGIAFSAFLAGGAELLQACGTTPSNQVQSSAPVKGGHVVEGAIVDITNLNTAISPGNTNSLRTNLLIFDGLLFFNAKGDLIPAIARELPTVSPDGTVYTFKLRQDVRFSDGSQLTADDVKFTYDLMFAPEYKEVPSPRRGDLETYVRSIQTPDPYTVVFTLKQVWTPFLIQHGYYGIMPKKVFAGMSAKQIATADFNTNPTITSGQYKLGKWEKGQQITLVRNDLYYGQKAWLDRYVRRNVGDSVALTSQLKTGEVDVAAIDPSLRDSVSSASNLQLIRFDIPTIAFYAHNLNPEKPAYKFFGDRSVRQALLYALNRQQIAQAVYSNQATVARSWISPTIWAYNPDTKPQYGYDPKKAASLLDAAGWKLNTGTGIREKSGVPFSISIDVGSSAKEAMAAAQIMQQQWKAAGVQLEVKTLEGTTLIQNFEFKHDHFLSMISINQTTDPDISIFFHSRNSVAGGLNGMAYKNPEVDKLLDDGVATLDRGKRKAIYTKLQNILAEDIPAVPIFVLKGLYGANKRVKGFDFWGGYQGRPWQKNLWVSDGK